MKSVIYFTFLLLLLGICVATDPRTPGYGPEKAKQVSGYITVPGFRNDNGSHIYFWFFESRSNPETDPLVFWFTGGPGCSGLTALFAENGPYQVNSDMSLNVNPWSWNSNANILWIDQPVGTGYSYVDNWQNYPTDEEQVSTDLYQFLQIFLKQYPKYSRIPFYIIGESYAGHYNSHFASYIVRMNSNPDYPKINLKGVGIGNGFVDPRTQYGEYANFMYSKKMISDVQRNFYNNYSYPACTTLIDSGYWLPAMATCNAGMLGVLLQAELNLGRTINVYDVRIPCKVPPLCYDFSDITRFLNLRSTKEALGVNPAFEWKSCEFAPRTALLGDWITSFAQDLTMVMRAGVRVLIYNGVEDYICNNVGGSVWVHNLKWSGQGGFHAAPFLPWKVDGKQAGRSKSYSFLSLLEIYGAGHMAPMDQPKATLDMFNKFLTNRPLAN